jgi:hypothetical protein
MSNLTNRQKRDFILFLAASALLGITQSVEGSAFNNFLSETFTISVMQRTLIEIPRELPGFMVVFIAGALMFLGDRRMAVCANIAAGAGMLLLGHFSPMLSMAVLWTFIWSCGQHLYIPLASSIGMGFADKGSVGKRLGMIGSAHTAVLLAMNLATFFVLRQFQETPTGTYRVLFTVGAGAFIAAGVLMAFMSKPETAPRTEKRRIVFRREYRLYYALSVVYGARKQIFITFGPWVLIKVFGQSVGTFALLGFAIAGIGIFFRPLMGWCIDRYGERFVLMCDAVLLILVCLGYGFAETVTNFFGFPVHYALAAVSVCFVADQLLASTGMARATYLRKIAVKDEDVPIQLSMGVSMDHIVSMFIPFCGAFLWELAGYSMVFLGGAVIALINFILAMRIRFNIAVDGNTSDK